MRQADLGLNVQAQLRAREPVSAPKKRVAKDNTAERMFAFQCRAMKLPAVSAQFTMPRPGVFTPKTRKQSTWVFDFAFPELKLLVEIDGGIWIGGAHGHPLDITRNMTKQNDATLAEFALLRFTPAEVKSGHAIAFTQRVLAHKGWKP
jgi:very-short-patch-repair endonuclease